MREKICFSKVQSEIEQAYANEESVSFQNRLILSFFSLCRVVIESDVTTRSAALSYNVAFSLVPLVTTSIAFLTAFPGLQTERDRLLNLLSSQLLPSAVQSVQSYITQFAERAAAAGAVSSLVFFIVVLMLFESLESAFNGIWRVKKARTWGERLRTVALFFVSGALATTLFVIVQKEATSFIERASDLKFLGIGRLVGEASVLFTQLFVAWGLFSMAYRFLPNEKIKWRSSIIAGTIIGTIWTFLKSGFTWYINEVASYQSIYGTLGAIPVFFLWVYLSFLLLLIGGYISFIAQDLRTLVLEKRARSKGRSRAFYSVLVSGILAQGFQAREEPLSAKEIALRLQVPVYFVRDALVALCSYGVAALVFAQNEERYLLAKPSESVTVSQIVEQVTGDVLSIPESKQRGTLHRYVEQVFTEARDHTRDSLRKVTLADLATYTQASERAIS